MHICELSFGRMIRNNKQKNVPAFYSDKVKMVNKTVKKDKSFSG